MAKVRYRTLGTVLTTPCPAGLLQLPGCPSSIIMVGSSVCRKCSYHKGQAFDYNPGGTVECDNPAVEEKNWEAQKQ